MIEDKTILWELEKDREGITITDLAEKLQTHRHTITKYLYKLEGEGKITIRKVGIAKLCYLNGEYGN